MSEQDKTIDEAATAADAKEKAEELSEEELESVAGGVLIGLNLSTIKGESAIKLVPDATGLAFKDMVTSKFVKL